MSDQPILSVRDLKVAFGTKKVSNEVLHGISFDVYPGETVAIVGESGSGKSTTMHAVINLLPGTGKITDGSVQWEGRELVGIGRRDMETIRGREIGLVPQDPMSNLNPVWSIGFQVEEAIRANGLASGRKEVRERAVEVLQQAGLTDVEKRMKQYPHQFSGGMKQRALIGIGLAASPQLLIADEPTSALDVTVQRVVLDHLEKLTSELGTAVVFITHDLGLAAERAEKLIVMYKGNIVESGPSKEILQHPRHPYTKRLVAAAPSLASRRIGADATLPAAPTSAFDVAAIAEENAKSKVTIGEPLIEVDNLGKIYPIRKGNFGSEDFHAVSGATFTVNRGETLALVGESGSGKSTIAKMVLQLEKPSSGTIRIGGVDTAKMSSKSLFELRRTLQPVFQDPYGSLDPLYNIGNTIMEPLKIHNVGDQASRRARMYELLDQVSLPRDLATRYPNELSGGQRQRVAVARGLALKPDILVLDEAVSALDVLVQAQVLDLLAELQRDLGLTYLFITHDLAVVRLIADRVCVMQQGKIVEQASTDEVFENPQEEYTKNLLAAIPGAGIELGVN
ncbi:peptide/nickel transport system ATP-binding protein [Leucobacter luti]|uniref:dipeptide ABC transporter ATP-binding protein n=1 Tax=Leucobacter luti TaxID=340320 RepID=UPI00104883EE|nr:ABC transporter ATP-binding protein [Leucobacter luti]MCW2288469.1 peptide/nickel transport system ATP-binding protein [Leucobacter luti]TCK45375.1 peptide/nickel transport system ATP-binding protein [Leucobacter luti]